MHTFRSTGDGRCIEGKLIEELNAQVDRAQGRSEVISVLNAALEVISPREYPQLVQRIESALQYAKEQWI